MLGAFVLINILINQYYGTELVGVYALSFSIAQIGILGIGGVFSLLMRRDLSIGQFDSNDYLSKVQLLRFCNLAIVLLVAFVFIFFFYQQLRVNLLFIALMIISKGFDALSESYYTAYQTLNRLGEYSFFKILNATTVIVASVFVCINHYDFKFLFWSQFFAAVLMFTVNFFRWHQTKSISVEPTTPQKVGFRFLLVEAFPPMVSALIFQLGLRANNVLIFDNLGEKDLGIFSIVFITISIVTGVANALALVFFGRLSKVFALDPKAFSKRLHQTIALFLTVGVFFFLLYLVFTPIIENLFGLTIDHSLYQTMSATIPFTFVVSCLGSVFTIIKKQKIGMYLSAVVLIVNLSAYYFLVGRYGLIGAGYAFLISALFQSIIIYFGTLMCLRFK
jgi:O-antigen/teichoic acid export membrane protein